MKKQSFLPPEILAYWTDSLDQIIGEQLDLLCFRKGEDHPYRRARYQAQKDDPHKLDKLKIPELMKLMDKMQELSAMQPGSQEFWQMIEQIRRDKLPAAPQPHPVYKPVIDPPPDPQPQ